MSRFNISAANSQSPESEWVPPSNEARGWTSGFRSENRVNKLVYGFVDVNEASERMAYVEVMTGPSARHLSMVACVSGEQADLLEVMRNPEEAAWLFSELVPTLDQARLSA